MAGEIYELIFSEETNKRYRIDQPIGDVSYVLQQKENRMGRDESLNGGENRFRFTDYRNHYIEKLFYYFHSRGFEADIVLGVVTIQENVYESELHFVDGGTDEITYIECRTIVKGSQQVIKSRRETKVDMFSSETIDGEFINPLVPTNMLLKAKPNLQISEWEQTQDAYFYLSAKDDKYVLVNPAQVLKKSGIEDTYTFFQSSSDITTDNLNADNANVFKVLTAQSNLKNVVLNIPSVDIQFDTHTASGGNGYMDYVLLVRKGDFYYTSEQYSLLQTHKTENQNYSFSGALSSFNIGDVNRGESVWFAHYFRLRQSSALSSALFYANVFVKNMKFNISGESTAYNSIVPTFRLIDVMRQVIKSISGQSVLSQRYDFAGEFYDNVFFNGNLMRFEPDKPFYVSLADIEDFIWGEHKGDSEIQEDGTVFFGIERDFYTNVECGFFDDTQFDSMQKVTNQKYALNEFKFKYGKYQSLKENIEPNSDSTIHGESIWTLFNKRAPNKLEINIEPVRDAILIDAQQRLATKISEDTATQDDDTIFVVDVIETTSDYTFTETTNLQHTYTAPYLTLRSNGEVNFLVLGIKPFTRFIIETPNVNAGTFTVQSVNTTEIVLSGGTWSSVNDGVKLTKYTYEIKKETIPLTNRTNEGFTAISDLISPERYSNLRYSIKRNILNYWSSTLATVNLFWKDKLLRNTYYKNNGKASTTYAGLTTVEKDPFMPKDPIVSPFKYENLTYVNVDFDDYIELRTRIKKDRGYIRGINQKKRVIKVFTEKVTYVNSEKRLVITGEEKFESAYLTISNEGGIILVNNEMKLIRLIYEFDSVSQEIILYDKERFRLYNGVFWDKVTVNGSNAETIEQLISWLDLLV